MLRGRISSSTNARVRRLQTTRWNRHVQIHNLLEFAANRFEWIAEDFLKFHERRHVALQCLQRTKWFRHNDEIAHLLERLHALPHSPSGLPNTKSTRRTRRLENVEPIQTATEIDDRKNTWLAWDARRRLRWRRIAVHTPPRQWIGFRTTRGHERRHPRTVNCPSTVRIRAIAVERYEDRPSSALLEYKRTTTAAAS